MAIIKKIPFPFFIVLSLALHIFRIPDAVVHPQFWAEDGATFFANDFQYGPSMLFQAYQGYLHLWPRIGAFFVGFTPIEWAPFLYVCLSLLTHLFLLSIISYKRFSATRNQKILLLLSTVLVPHEGEIFLNLTNTNSFCALITIFLAILKPSPNLIVRILEGIAITISGLSGPFILLTFFPLLIYLIQREWSRIHKIEKTFFLLIPFLTQALFLDIGNRSAPNADPSLKHWLHTFAVTLKSLFLSNLHMSSFLTFVIASVFFIFLWRIFIPRNFYKEIKNISVPFLLFICATLILASCYFISKSFIDYIGPFSNGPRYFYVPYVLILFGIILKSGNKPIAPAHLYMIALSFCTSLCFYQSKTPRPNLHWQDQVISFHKQGNYVFRILPTWVFFPLDQRNEFRNNRPKAQSLVRVISEHSVRWSQEQ